MGMSYSWSGSASYPRFDKELFAVAEVFGGHLNEREATEIERLCGYWFGFLSSDNSNEAKFVFPNGTNEVLVKWFNNIYGDFTVEETQTVWEHISKHAEIKEISSQIWNELKMCDELNDAWDIC